MLWTFHNLISLAGILTMVLERKTTPYPTQLLQKSAWVPRKGVMLPLYKSGGPAVCIFHTQRHPFPPSLPNCRMVVCKQCIFRATPASVETEAENWVFNKHQPPCCWLPMAEQHILPSPLIHSANYLTSLIPQSQSLQGIGEGEGGEE